MTNTEKESLLNTDLGVEFLAKYRQALNEIHKDVIELDDVIQHIFIAMLADGHVILDGEPGVGKTLVAHAVAKTIDVSCSFIQFTPETMPQDLFYSMGCLEDDGKSKTLRDMTLTKGPIFSRIIIADEINRAIPRIHGALLSPLEEKKVSLEGKEHDLSPYYFWVATQNPVESSESTSLLPEALQERFMLMVKVPYPSKDLLRRIATHDTRPHAVAKVFEMKEIVKVQNAIFEQYVLSRYKDDPIVSYIQRLVSSIHDHPVVRWGPGIRAAQDLMRAAAVHAFLHEKPHITFDDVKSIALPVLRFKFQLNHRKARKHSPPITSNDDIIQQVLTIESLTDGSL
jgi:MoxR-like ATPase